MLLLTIADAGAGDVPNGCGPESECGRNSPGLYAIIQAKTKRMPVKLEVFVLCLVKLIADINTETAVQQIKDFGTHRLLDTHKPTSAMWL
jgi:hypothetical protein